MYTNADSLINKVEELKLLIDSLDNRPNIIAITEAKSKTKKSLINLSEFNIDGYSIISNDLDSDSNSRGIIIYIDNNIDYSIMECQTKYKEFVFIKLNLNTKIELHLCVFYRSPSSLDDNNRLLLKLVAEMCESKKDNLMFIGDFNLPGIDWNNWCSINNTQYEVDFINTLRDFYLYQHVTSPTRARGTDTPHILDLVISNESFIDEIKYLAPLGKSDHAVLCIKSRLQCNYRLVKNKLNYNKGDYVSLRQSFDIDWDLALEPFLNDVDAMWNLFKDRVIRNTQEFIPPVKVFKCPVNKNWRQPLPESIRDLVKAKNKAWKKYITTKSKSCSDKFKQIRNKVRNATRARLRNEQDNISRQCKNNPKKFWNYIKTKTKITQSIGDIRYVGNDGSESYANTDNEKANIFCNYFSSVFNIEDDCAFERPPIRDNVTSMSEINFNCVDIACRLKKLNVNKSEGPDGIHPRVLAECFEVLAYPLKLIFEKSFSLNKLPLDWRSGNITTIFKKGSRLDACNYRPVSLTCICCKLIESIVRDHITEHLISNKVLSNKQFGFIKGRSTVMQLLKVMDMWTESLELGGQVDVIYTDLEKAFDKVPHKRLISKLHSYKINEGVVKWIESFLTNRRQRVRVNGYFSFWCQVLSGIPQGSVLGPLLFIIFINDLAECCSNGSELFLYADDAKLFRHILSKSDVEILQKDLSDLQAWLDKWLLKLNINKCKVVSFGHHIDSTNDYNLLSNGSVSVLEHINNIKDLGVTFDSDLKFDLHINEKINKAHSVMGLIYRNFKYMSTTTFIMLYKSLVRSHLEYANCVWSPFRQMDVEKIEKVQMRATRMIKQLRNYSYKNRLRFLNLPTLKYRRIRGDMIQVYNIISGLHDCDACINFNMSNISYTRGNMFKMQSTHTRYNMRKHFFSNRIIAIWNTLPNDVVSANTTNTFKVRLDKFWNNQNIKYDWNDDITGIGSRSLKCI